MKSGNLKLNIYYAVHVDGLNLGYVGITYLNWDIYGDDTITLEGPFPFIHRVNQLPGKTIEIIDRQDDRIASRIEIGIPISKDAYNLVAVTSTADVADEITMSATFKCKILFCDFFGIDEEEGGTKA